MPIHRHRVPYAALVLAGSYLEVGPDGAWACGEGDLVVHPPFHLHGDRFAVEGARILNLDVPLSLARTLGTDRYAVLRPRDLGLFLRTARKDPLMALGEALEAAPTVRPEQTRDWRDALVDRLGAEPRARVGTLAREAGVSAEHASRALTRWLGVPPARARSEHRVRKALRHLADPDQTLSEIALQAGYVDQAHMSRAIRATTGTTPARLRTELTTGRA